MPQGYHKPLKKYVSRKMAIEKLGIKPRQFDRLCVLCGIYPIVAPYRNRVDIEEGWYYEIDDVKRIYYSDAYDVLKSNLRINEKIEKCIKFNRTSKLEFYKEEEYGFVSLIKNKYSAFSESLSKLGESLSQLYIVKMLEIDQKSASVLDEFENFVTQNSLLSCGFMSQKGVYYSFNVEKIRVVWRVPYPGKDLKEIVEEKKDLEMRIKEENMTFLDFNYDGEDDSQSDDILDLNNPEKLDVSLLRYSAPLLATHIKLVIHKLQLIYSNRKRKEGIFKNKKIHVAIQSIPHMIELVLLNEGADLVSYEDAEITVIEKVEAFDSKMIYVQPQYVFDSLNKESMLNHDDYRPGKTLPIHVSPFPDIFEAVDSRVMSSISNKRKYKIMDRIEKLN